jgi:enoyl-[acyl-carrier-protein] reductase (NADH)
MLFLASPLSKAITGQVIYVDHGLGIMGRPTQNAAKKEEALV